MDFTIPVKRIDGFGGADIIQINADISDLLIFGDSAGTAVGIDGDDYIEVDLDNVNADAAATTSDNGAYVYGEGGNDYIAGSQRVDWISGGVGHDFVSGNRGDDQISGGTGNDWLQGDAGNDVITGNTGNDRLLGGAGGDVLSGGAGNDRLWGDAGGAGYFRDESGSAWDGETEILTTTSALSYFADATLGEGGGDVLQGGAGNDSLYGGEGVDFLYGEADHDRLEGEAGDDWLFGGSGRDVLWGDKDPHLSDAINELDPDGIPFRLHADGADVAGNDHLDGGRETDVLLGGGGDDTYYFGFGDGVDVIRDKSGVDSIRLGDGIGVADVRFSHSSGDLIIDLSSGGTQTGDQLIVNGWFTGKPVESVVIDETFVMTVADIEAATGVSSAPEDPTITDALNLIVLTESADTPLATTGDDTIYGLGGNDILAGGSGNDRLIGGAGDDELSGNDDDDVLIGEGGDDDLYGQSGNDTLIGGAGNDDLLGGGCNEFRVLSHHSLWRKSWQDAKNLNRYSQTT